MRHHLGMDSCVIVSARYVPKGDAPLDRHTLFTALSYVILKERPLSMQIRGDGSRDPIFVRLDTVDLSQVVEFRDDDSSVIESVMTLHWLRPFDVGTSSPLWRLSVFQDNTVLFAYHHAIGDGQSGLAFHRSLLSALNRLAELPPVTSDVVSIPSSLAPQPALENVVKTSVSFLTWCREVYGILAPAKLTPQFTAWTANTVSSTTTLQNNVRRWEIPPEDAKALLQLCRENKSTLTSFFHTLATLVASYLLATKYPPAYKCKTIPFSVPVSLRRVTNAPRDAICDHVSSVKTYEKILTFPSIEKGKQPLVESFSWETSAKYAAKLRKAAASSPELIGLFKFIFGRYKEFYQGKLGKKRDNGIEISNLGVFPAEQAEPAAGTGWTVEQVFFSQCDATAGAALKINVAGSPSGAVGIAFTWGDGAVDTAFAEAFVEEFKEAVEVILHKGKPKNGL
ncbi:hypothetical protein NLI96_g3226 [Meripilus lineatus]|uniref:Alcohol acetyltransferase n=1 Tax=Meripilus lineatus TaxID=2056292 RepID=A0AAD5YGT2_9APHY|nr:hypothetical protein NLI96_g3226 [Physisporinus lineatus]